jgi:enoyl-CoA hydratase/carnithine racemase
VTATGADDGVLVVETRGRVGVAVLNRPASRNALSPQLLLALHAALEEWKQRDEVRVVVITGAGDKAFCSGFDIGAIPTGGPPTAPAGGADSLQLALSATKEFPYPTIAMVNGYCFGAGLNLALCCDLRVGVDDIAAGMPPARLGVVYPVEGLAQFVRVLGTARARELFFTARTYRGADALAMGLVDRLVPRAELAHTTFALAEEIAANAPAALRGMKRIMNLLEATDSLPPAARDEAESLVAAALLSDDAREAQRAFLEKRRPDFDRR